MAYDGPYKPITVSDSGIGSFLSSNMDEVDDSVLAFGQPSGINSFYDTAEKMAQMGAAETDTWSTRLNAR
jgi:hypothetical protein